MIRFCFPLFYQVFFVSLLYEKERPDSHYLNALELESGAEEPLSDMEHEAFLETIQDLKESIRNSNDMIRSLQSELERSNRVSEQYLTMIADLRSVISDLQKKLDEREKEISDLRDLNNRHNKMTFGNKSTSRKHKRPAQKRGRDEEKEDCGGVIRLHLKRQILKSRKSH